MILILFKPIYYFFNAVLQNYHYFSIINIFSIFNQLIITNLIPNTIKNKITFHLT